MAHLCGGKKFSNPWHGYSSVTTEFLKMGNIDENSNDTKEKIWLLSFQRPKRTGGGGDVPPARVYFFKLSSLAKGKLFSNFSPFSLGKSMLFVNVCRL